MKILCCTEFSQLHTGYAVYSKAILEALHERGHEIIELACACNEGDPRIDQVPWKVYWNIPKNEAQKAIFDRVHGAKFGAWQFEEILIKEKPTHVIEYRDFWTMEYQGRSPLRNYFSWVIMPAVDAENPNKHWVDMVSRADAVLSYTDWGIDTLKQEGLHINFTGSAPSWAPDEFVPLNKNESKSETGLGQPKIIGMVGRNQKRKLFPDLFKVFSDFLKHPESDNVYLYCHTAYPDRGWEIDEELLKYGISHRVLLPYQCKTCGWIDISVYRGAKSYCLNCGSINSGTVHSEFGLNNRQMAHIYNMMDLYVQWASNEGLGIPPIEAAACTVPSVLVNYSAMSEVAQLLKSDAIDPVGKYQEIETGRLFSVPDNEALLQYFIHFFSLPTQLQRLKGINSRIAYEDKFVRNRDQIIDNWIKAIESTQPRKSWNAPKELVEIPEYPRGLDNRTFAKWLIANVLRKPEYLNSEMELRLIRDLNNEFTPGYFNGLYYHELNAVSLHGLPHRYQQFNQQIAYDTFVNMRKELNYWENRR